MNRIAAIVAASITAGLSFAALGAMAASQGVLDIGTAIPAVAKAVTFSDDHDDHDDYEDHDEYEDHDDHDDEKREKHEKAEREHGDD